MKDPRSLEKWIHSHLPDVISSATHNRLLEILPKVGLSSTITSSLNLSTRSIALSFLKFGAILRMDSARSPPWLHNVGDYSTCITHLGLVGTMPKPVTDSWQFFNEIAEEVREIIEKLPPIPAKATAPRTTTLSPAVITSSSPSNSQLTGFKREWSIDAVCALLDRLNLAHLKDNFRTEEVCNLINPYFSIYPQLFDYIAIIYIN